MTLSIRPSSNFPYSIIADDVCTIIDEYLACTAEAEEAFCLRRSQSKESFDKRTNLIIKNIWRSFVEEIVPKNGILEDYIEKFSRIPESDIKTRLYSVETFMESYIESKMAASEEKVVESINRQFPNRPFNLSKLKALTHAMNEAAEVDALKKIWIQVSVCDNHALGETIDVQATKQWRVKADFRETFKSDFEGFETLIDEVRNLDLSELEMGMIPALFLSAPIRGLLRLDLSFNKLRAVPQGLGGRWTSLLKIHLQGNKLRSLPSDFGENWPALSELDLSNNQILSLPEGFGKNWNGLIELDLSNNQLSSLPEKFGDNWSKLEWISLKHNQFQSLPSDFGSVWEALEELNLSNNRLSSLPAGVEESWPELKGIWLERNQIQSLPSAFGSKWGRLQKIDVDQSAFRTLPRGFEQIWPKSVEISVIDDSTSSSQQMEETPMEEEKSVEPEPRHLSQGKTSGTKRPLDQSAEDEEEEKQSYKKVKSDSDPKGAD